jgi:hypothetical protein
VVAALEKQIKRWTYEEYYKLEDDQRYEIIDGHLEEWPVRTSLLRRGKGQAEFRGFDRIGV